MSFFQELARRNVVKVAGLYVVAAWLLLQVADVLTDMLPVPDWTGTLVFLLLLLGFPVVLIFSWVYEITPEGVRRDTGDGDASTAAATPGRRLDVLIIVLLAAVLAALAVDRFAPDDRNNGDVTTGTETEAPESMPAEAPAQRTIAVLPFLNMSKDPNEEYFSDGVSVQILNELSSVEGFKVTSQRSSFAFKDQNKSLQEIARLLDIQYVIDGSVFRDGDRIRITAQLVDAVGDQNIWTEIYNERAEDLFKIQDDIARSITGRLQQEGFTQVNTGTATEVPSFDAYDLYLQGSEHARNERYVEAAELLDQVLQQEPNFVAALALRAEVEILMSDVFFGAKLKPVREVMPRVDGWLAKAEAIDAFAPDVLAGRGLYHELRIETIDASDLETDELGRLFEEAEQLYKESLRLRPNSTEVRDHLARLLGRVGREPEAIEQLQIALTYDPANPGLNGSLFNWSVMQHDLELALDTLDRWRELSPDSLVQQMHRARYLRFAGELAASFETLKALQEQATPAQREILSEPMGEVLLALGEYERAASVPRNDPKYKIRALTLQGRHGEAVLTAKRWVRQEPGLVWPIDELLRALYYARRWDEFVDLYEENIEQALVFRDYHYFSMLSMAYAPYRESELSRVKDLENYWGPALQSAESEDFGKPEVHLLLARVLTIYGREDEAVAALRDAVDKFLYTPRIAIDPVLGRLSGRSDYQALLDDIENKINAERDKLGLPPTTILRRSASEDT